MTRFIAATPFADPSQHSYITYWLKLVKAASLQNYYFYHMNYSIS